MTPAYPKISVATIVYNRADLLRETISCVLSQTLSPHEYLIIDDGSTDHIQQVLAEFPSGTIKYHRQEHCGLLTRLRQKAVTLALGDYIAFIDSDDLWHPSKLEIMLSHAERTGAVMLLCDSRYFDTSGFIGRPIGATLIRKDDVFWELINRNHSYAFGTNLFFRNIPGLENFDPRLRGGDHDFMLRNSACHKTEYVDQVLNYIRRHPGNLTGPMSFTDIVSLHEYNRTLNKLYAAHRIKRRLYKKIRATNYAKIGLAYYVRRRYRKSVLYLLCSLSLSPATGHAKLAVKSLCRYFFESLMQLKLPRRSVPA